LPVASRDKSTTSVDKIARAVAYAIEHPDDLDANEIIGVLTARMHELM